MNDCYIFDLHLCLGKTIFEAHHYLSVNHFTNDIIILFEIIPSLKTIFNVLRFKFHVLVKTIR